MHNSAVYEHEVIISRTRVSEMLEQSNSTCFTVQFRTQVN